MYFLPFKVKQTITENEKCWSKLVGVDLRIQKCYILCISHMKLCTRMLKWTPMSAPCVIVGVGQSFVLTTTSETLLPTVITFDTSFWPSWASPIPTPKSSLLCSSMIIAESESFNVSESAIDFLTSVSSNRLLLESRFFRSFLIRACCRPITWKI